MVDATIDSLTPEESKLHHITTEMVHTFGRVGSGSRLIIAILVGVVLWGGACYIYQLCVGLSATAMNDYFSWGVYIIDYIFLIGVGMAGTLTSAMLRLTGARWRHPITRLAEVVTLVALLIAGPIVIVDMGRPDRFWHILVYGRLQSPILWDVLSLVTYLAGSMLYLYLPMVPDMAILRDTPLPLSNRRRRLYRAMALGWQNTPDQCRRLDRCIQVMAIIIIPVAVSLHTITAWIFDMTLRPGWHSSIIGPDYVVGAIYSGIAAVITVMAIVRSGFGLQKYLTVDHFKKLGFLLLTLCLIYMYFTLNEYAGASYVNEGSEAIYLSHLFKGPYTVSFWSMLTVGMFIPAVLLSLPWTRKVGGIVTASVLVNIGMWLMRYIIVVPTLSAPYLPFPKEVSHVYMPTVVEWSITAAAFAMMALLYITFSKLFPIISIWEMAHDEPAVHAYANASAVPHSSGLEART